MIAQIERIDINENVYAALMLFRKETADIRIDTKFSTNILKRDLGSIRIMLPSNGGNIHGHPEKKGRVCG